MSARPLDAFLAALPDERRDALARDPDLAGALDAALARAADLVEPARRADLAAHLGRVAGPHLTGADGLRALPAADLALAWRAGAGDGRAITALVAAHAADLRAAIRSTGLDDAAAAEVWSAALAELTVPADGRPGGLAGYGGRGSLRGWLRAVVVRKAMRAARPDPRAADVDLDALADVARDPAAQALHDRYRPEVEDALRAGFAALAPDQRTLLRQHHLDGLSIDRLGAIHGVHRATAARWLAAARDAVLEVCRQRLRDRLGATTAEIDSVVRVVLGELHVSVARHLGDDAG